MATAIIYPYNLGCQKLGPRLYTYSDHNSFHSYLLQAGSHPAQLFLHVARERMTAKNPPTTNGVIDRKQGISESNRMLQDGSYQDIVMETTESRVLG